MSSSIAASEKSKELPAELENALFAELRPIPVSPERSQRIRSRVDAELGFSTGVVTHRLLEGKWIRRSPDCEIKILNRDSETGICSYLVRLQANGQIPEHMHPQPEECVVLEGDVEVDGMTLGPGDYQWLDAGTRHQPIRSRSGLLMFIRAHLDLAA